MTPGLSEAPGIGRLLMENRFSVPNHQRDYSWTREEISELIDDVTGAIKSGSNLYFVGLMVFQGTDASRLTVLDGQQRLATAVILLSAVRSWLRQFDEFRQDADDIQRDYIGRRELGERELNPRFTMNSANHETFLEFIIRSSTTVEIEAAIKVMKKRDRNRRLLEATLFLHRWVREKAESFSSRADAARYFFSLVNFVRDGVGAVKLIVPDDEMAYTVFETVNDRGLQLSPLDLVKNHLFRSAAARSAQSKSDAPIRDLEERWGQMMHTLANVRSDHFLKAFWTSRHGLIRTRNLFGEFKKQYSDAEKTNDLSKDMLESSEQYAALDVADDPVWAPYPAEARATVRSLKIIGSQQTHPVMLSALSRMEPNEVERLLRLLEVCFVRYLLVGEGNPGRFEGACSSLARRIYTKEVTTATAAASELKDVLPTDDDFRAAFEAKEEENNQKAQYYLRKLEIERRRIKSAKMAGELEPSPLTVEHILPKNPGAEWGSVLQDDPTLAEEYTFRLGNMCLLTDINRRLGRASFPAKKAYYRSSSLELTNELALGDDDWNRGKIEDRQKAMAKLAVAVWRFQ